MWREACTPESITILDWDVNNRSIQSLEFSKFRVRSVIICYKPNFEVRSWIWKLVISILHHCLDFALKSPITVRNGLHVDNESRFSSGFDLNIWNSPCVWLGELYRWIKRQTLLAMLTSKFVHSFRFEIFITLNGIELNHFISCWQKVHAVSLDHITKYN